MRFINTSTLRLERVADFDIQNTQKYPEGYAILSHRWGEEGSEVDFEDLSGLPGDDHRDNTRVEQVKSKTGWPKFEGACSLAKQQGFGLIWIDTCCIDKRDSVELSEAINSMYRWYAEARVCFVYLQDVREGSDKPFEQSTWFERGWTLQELIAPREVWFYDYRWSYIGNKWGLAHTIHARAGVEIEVLLHKKLPGSCSVAQRMSWAAGRHTTRTEDAAYSLMGLFDVNMPMLYGEREKAFIRLQEEIIKKNGDLSIFAWEMESPNPAVAEASAHFCGMLAPSPACFARSGVYATHVAPETFGIGQRGLSIKLEYRPYGLEWYTAKLFTISLDPPESICIVLARAQSEGQFVRVNFLDGGSLSLASMDASHTYPMKEFHVRQDRQEVPLRIYTGFWLRGLDGLDRPDRELQISSRAEVSDRSRISLGQRRTGIAGIIKCKPFTSVDTTYFMWMMLGFDKDANPVCFLIDHGPHAGQWVNRRMFEMVMKTPPADCEVERFKLFDDRILDSFPPNYQSMEKYGEYHLIRGDSEKGIKTTIRLQMPLDRESRAVRVDVDIFIECCPNRVESESQKIWTVDITGRGERIVHLPGAGQPKPWFRRPIFLSKKI